VSYDAGIDRYEAQSIAESAARDAAQDAKRDIGYDLDRLRDDLRQLRSELEEERISRRAAVDELHEYLAEVRASASPGGHQHPELTT